LLPKPWLSSDSSLGVLFLLFPSSYLHLIMRVSECYRPVVSVQGIPTPRGSDDSLLSEFFPPMSQSPVLRLTPLFSSPTSSQFFRLCEQTSLFSFCLGQPYCCASSFSLIFSGLFRILFRVTPPPFLAFSTITRSHNRHETTLTASQHNVSFLAF